MIRRFNANVPYNGLSYSNLNEVLFLFLKFFLKGLLFKSFLPDSKGRSIISCLEAVLSESYIEASVNNGQSASSSVTQNSKQNENNSIEVVYKIESQLACLHRLFASKIGFLAFTSVNG